MTKPRQTRRQAIRYSSPMKTYICIVCGFVYDEAAGGPEDGLAAGTQWADIPVSWACPDCGVAKADFEVAQL